jgi:hypothetical protein
MLNRHFTLRRMGVLFFSVPQQPRSGLGHLIVQVCRSHHPYPCQQAGIEHAIPAVRCLLIYALGHTPTEIMDIVTIFLQGTC